MSDKSHFQNYVTFVLSFVSVITAQYTVTLQQLI
jgi:hypothetical protein